MGKSSTLYYELTMKNDKFLYHINFEGESNYVIS